MERLSNLNHEKCHQHQRFAGNVPQRPAREDLPADALITPSARDFLRELGNERRREKSGNRQFQQRQTFAARKKIKFQIAPSRNSRRFSIRLTHRIWEQLCDVGRRLWQREYVDGNGGNIAIRVGEDIAICTPTLVSKGFMKPADMCLVDFEGNQLAGTKRRTSEILMHLQIMKRQPQGGRDVPLPSAVRDRRSRSRAFCRRHA